jgi:hypothetical protein
MSKRPAQGQLDSEMPLRQYFLFVGGALLTLLLAANWLLPPPASNELTNSRVRLPPIRIHSELKGPKAVVIDTTKSKIASMPAPEDVVMPQAVAPSESTADEAFAQRDASSRLQLAADGQRTGEGERQTRKLMAAGLEPRPTSIHGLPMRVKPYIASLRSDLKFRETFAQFVPHSLKQSGQRKAITGRRAVVSGWDQ